MDLIQTKSTFKNYLPKLMKEGIWSSPGSNWGKNKFVYLFEFAGAIGSGKTATADAVVEIIEKCGIAKNFRVLKINEDIITESNKKAIDDFYSNRGDKSELENIICGNRIQKLIDTLNVGLECGEETIIISDRAVEEDCKFIESLRKDCGPEVSCKLLSIKRNIERFLNEINNFNTRIIHYVLYLNPGLDKAMERIRHRGRPNEQQINKELLKELTTFPNEFEYGGFYEIDNSNLNISEAALMSYENIICAMANPEITLPLHKVLVSFYGVPGSGKTCFTKEMAKRLHSFSFEEGCDPDFCCYILDRSEEKNIMDAQSEVYSGGGELTPDEMQNWIDRRRKDDFEEEMADPFFVFSFTDVGPLTSGIFREFTNCKKQDENELSKWLLSKSGGNIDIFVNVVVKNSGNFYVVRNHIKERGRPGEYEYFTEDKLREIEGIIENHINKQLASNKSEAFETMVICENDYTEKSLDTMFHKVMETIKNAIIGYSTSK